jgi:hypothetical protein
MVHFEQKNNVPALILEIEERVRLGHRPAINLSEVMQDSKK